MKRRALIILMFATVLLGASAIAVEVVLRSDFPRAMTVEQLQQKTGLVWSVASQHTGWSGGSTLVDVEVRSPMDAKPLLRADRIIVEHTPLLQMIAGGLTIERLVVDGAAVEIVQEPDGSTNIQQAIETILASQSRTSSGGSSGGVDLPALEVPGASITLTDADGQSRTIDSASLHGRSAGAMTWTFALGLPGTAEINGRLVTGGLWRHEIEISARDLGALEHMLDPEIAEHLRTLQGEGTWTGQRRGDSVIGRLALASVHGSFGSASGSLGVRSDESSIHIEDLTLQIRSDAFGSQAMFVTGGPISVNSERVRFDRVHVRDPNFNAEFVAHGEWNQSARVGSVEAHWEAFHPDISVRHSGSMEATIDMPSLGDARLAAHIESRGSEPALGSWDLRTSIDARGPSLEHASVHLRAERLRLERDGRTLAFDDAYAAIERSGSVLTIDRVIVPGYQSTTSGTFDLADNSWSLALALRQWNAPTIGPVPPVGLVDVRLTANGDLQHVFVTSLEAIAPHARCTASGSYVTLANPPFEADVALKLRPDAQWSITPAPQPGPSSSPAAPASSSRIPPSLPTSAEQATLISMFSSLFSTPEPRTSWARRSKIELRASVSGAFAPLSLLASGELTAADVPLWDDARLDRVQSIVNAQVSDELATLNADVRDVLGGEARVDGEFDRRSGDIVANIAASELAADNVAHLLDADVSMKGQAKIDGQVRAHVDQLSNIAFSGRWSVADAEVANQPLGAVNGLLAIDDGVARITDIEASRDDGSMLSGEAAFDLATGVLEAEFIAASWIARTPELSGSVTLDADVAGQVNVRTGSVDARAHVTGRANVEGWPTLPLVVRAEMADDTLQVQQAEMVLLGGFASATGELQVNDLRSARGEINWTGIDLERLSELWPDASTIPENLALRGTLGGVMKVHPAVDPRAMEPTQASITLLPVDASIGAMTLSESTFTMQLGPTRAMVDASHLELAGGSIDAWAQVSWAHDGPFAQLQATFARLELDQIVRTIDAESAHVPGLLDGRLALGGYVLSPHRAFGQAEMQVRASDLANIPLISVLYRTMNLRIDEPQPEGEGIVRARLDGDALDVTRATYFNRGVDIVSLLRIENVWQGADSPINGFAVGALRPLKKIDLPVIRDIDKAMKVFQAGAGSVRISGTVGEHEIKAVPFADIAGAVRSALRGL